jgi:hypothetical protein
MDIIPLWGFHVFYIVTIATFMASATVVKFGKKLQVRKKSFLTNIPFLIGLIMGSLSAAFWLIVICNSEIYRKELTMEFFVHCAWLPFANITSESFALYFDIFLLFFSVLFVICIHIFIVNDILVRLYHNVICFCMYINTCFCI